MANTVFVGRPYQRGRLGGLFAGAARLLIPLLQVLRLDYDWPELKGLGY